MYENLALLTIFILVYSSVAGAIERSWISGPMVFTCFGLFIGAEKKRGKFNLTPFSLIHRPLFLSGALVNLNPRQ